LWASFDEDLTVTVADRDLNFMVLMQLGRHSNLYNGPHKVLKGDPIFDDEFSSDDSKDDIVPQIGDDRETKNATDE
jgi:hypothetical protein